MNDDKRAAEKHARLDVLQATDVAPSSLKVDIVWLKRPEEQSNSKLLRDP